MGAKYNFGDLYNRPQELLFPSDYVPPVNTQAIDYSDWGYIPNVAQNAQNTPQTNFPRPGSYFSDAQAAVAQWFTTRVHLTPLGKV